MDERGCLGASSDTDPPLLGGRSPRRTPSEVAALGHADGWRRRKVNGSRPYRTHSASWSSTSTSPPPLTQLEIPPGHLVATVISLRSWRCGRCPLPSSSWWGDAVGEMLGEPAPVASAIRMPTQTETASPTSTMATSATQLAIVSWSAVGGAGSSTPVGPGRRGLVEAVRQRAAAAGEHCGRRSSRSAVVVSAWVSPPRCHRQDLIATCPTHHLNSPGVHCEKARLPQR